MSIKFILGNGYTGYLAHIHQLWNQEHVEVKFHTHIEPKKMTYYLVIWCIRTEAVHF